jgi:hypothetical protein
MHPLEKLIRQLESYIPDHGRVNNAVSSSGVGWHIEHSLITIQRIIRAVKASDPGTYKWSYKFNRMRVMITKTIPRGVAKAPQVVIPQEQTDEATLRASVNKALEMSKEIASIQRKQNFTHPYLGQLNKRAAIQFLVIHTHHHLKIIKDITAGLPH